MLSNVLSRAYFFLLIIFWLNKFSFTAGDGSQELLTKNITQILDSLLKDYDNNLHPNHRAGRPTIIQTHMLIRSMGPISEFDMNIEINHGRTHANTIFPWIVTFGNIGTLLRLSKDGDILYSMRLTIKAKCPMCLRSFPMDTQSCPLTFGSYAYTTEHIHYEWHGVAGVSYPQGIGVALSQFDLTSSPYTNFSLNRKDGEFSVLQVNFKLVRFAGYFLIQIYLPCILIVVLSFVGFFLNREATSDRVGLGVTCVLTLCTIGLDSRNDLPKVHYATALDWFLIMCWLYVMASLLECAGVHYFTKVGSGERREPLLYEEELEEPVENSSDWTDVQDHRHLGWPHPLAIYDTSSRSLEKKETRKVKKLPCFPQLLRCIVADQEFRRERQRAAEDDRTTNSVSKIDKISRVLFPLSFFFLNCFYWGIYSYSIDTC